MIEYACRICKKPTNKNPGGFYCHQCGEDWKRNAAMKYRVGDVWIWIRRNQIVRAVRDGTGKDIIPINYGKEMVE